MHSTRNHGHAQMFGLVHHPAAYDRHAGLFGRRIFRRIAADVAAADLPAGAVVLDVGTGPGRLPRLIAQACPQVTVQGVDLSPEMIAHATETAAAEGVPADRVRFDVADVADLPHESGSVDLVVSSLSLHHWEDRASGLREIARVLRPGGRAWIYDIRWVLRRTTADARRAAPGSYLEPRLAGARWFNPLGRLVLAPADPGTAPM